MGRVTTRGCCRPSPMAVPILQDADLFEVVNFVIDEPDQQPCSRSIEQIDGDSGSSSKTPTRSIAWAANTSTSSPKRRSYPVGHVAAYVTARRLAGEAKMPAPIFYALVRGGLPGDLGGLLTASPTVRSACFERAVNDKLVTERHGRRPPGIRSPERSPEAGGRTWPPSRRVRERLRCATCHEWSSPMPKPTTSSAGTRTPPVTSTRSGRASTTTRRPAPSGTRSNWEASPIITLPLVQRCRRDRLRDVSELASLPLAQWDQLLAESGTPPDTTGRDRRGAGDELSQSRPRSG